MFVGRTIFLVGHCPAQTNETYHLKGKVERVLTLVYFVTAVKTLNSLCNCEEYEHAYFRQKTEVQSNPALNAIHIV